MARHTFRNTTTGRFAKAPATRRLTTPYVRTPRGNRARSKQILSYQRSGDVNAQANRLIAQMRKLSAPSGIIAQANDASLKFLKKTAVANLDRKIKEHRRPENYRSGNLRAAIYNPKSHKITKNGFEFMVVAQVNKLVPYAFSLEYGDDSQIGRDIYFLFLGRSQRGARDGRTPNAGFNRRSDSQEKQRSVHKPRSAISARDRANGVSNLPRGNDPFFGVQHHNYSGAGETVTDRLIGPREFKGKKSGYIADGKRYRVTIKNPVPEYRYGRDAADEFKKEGIYEQELFKAYQAGIGKTPDLDLQPGPAKKLPKPRTANLKGRGKNGPVTVRKAKA